MKDKDKYIISDLPITDSDFIYNIHTKTFDKCIAIFTNGDMVVELHGSVGRAILRQEHYKKAIKS